MSFQLKYKDPETGEWKLHGEYPTFDIACAALDGLLDADKICWEIVDTQPEGA